MSYYPECHITRQKFSEHKAILDIFLGKSITKEQIISFSFSHFDKKKMKMATWIIINSLYSIIFLSIGNLDWPICCVL